MCVEVIMYVCVCVREIMCVSVCVRLYQDPFPLLWVWVLDGGELRVRVLLLLYGKGRSKVKGLKRCLDERVADTMHRRVHDFHL